MTGRDKLCYVILPNVVSKGMARIADQIKEWPALTVAFDCASTATMESLLAATVALGGEALLYSVVRVGEHHYTGAFLAGVLD
jgi:hypothetical protein